MIDKYKEEEILHLYSTGTPLEAIERKTSICVERAQKVLLQFGINTSDDFKQRKQQKLQEGLVLYNSGMQFKKICKEVGISPNTLRPFLKANVDHWHTQKDSLVAHMDTSEQGILKRSKSKKWYPINEHVFDDVTNLETAYWIGFLYADGTINCKYGSYRIALGLAEKDYGHLVKYCNFLQTPIERIKYSKSNNANYVIISSYVLNKRLQELGFDNQKSYSCKVHDSLCNSIDFWRGVFDGDGSLFESIRSDNGKIRRYVDICGSENTITQFREYLSRNGFKCNAISKKKDNFVWNIKYSGKDDIIKITSLLYKDATVYLDRKYKIYQEWTNN